jgi:preprotein translocase subunit SecG
MTTFLTVLHVMVCLVLILVVLLQRGKGSDIGAALGGGGSNTVFGSRGAGNFLTKLTTASAVLFMVTSLSLSYITTQEGQLQIFDEEPVPVEAESDLLEEVLDETGGEAEPEASANELVEIDPTGDGDTE